MFIRRSLLPTFMWHVRRMHRITPASSHHLYIQHGADHTYIQDLVDSKIDSNQPW